MRNSGIHPNSSRCKRQGFTLVEVMIASGLLALAFLGSIAAITTVQRDAVRNNLRSVALFTAEQTIEQLRARGKDALLPELELDDGGNTAIWIYDPVTAGDLPGQLTLRTGYDIVDGATIQDASRDIGMTLQCLVMTADASGTPDTTYLNVSVDVSWSFLGRTHTDSLYTILE